MPGQDEPAVVVSVAPVGDEVGQAVELHATSPATERLHGAVDQLDAARNRIGALD